MKREHVVERLSN